MTASEIDLFDQTESIRERLAYSPGHTVKTQVCAVIIERLFQSKYIIIQRYMRVRKECSPRRFQSSRLQNESKAHKTRDFPRSNWVYFRPQGPSFRRDYMMSRDVTNLVLSPE